MLRKWRKCVVNVSYLMLYQIYTVFQKKRSQYTSLHIFSKRGIILTIFAVLMPQ